MKRETILAACIGVICGAMSASAQAPTGSPAGATGLCKDGSYSTAAKKSGACSGHKGVQSWYAAEPGKSSSTSAVPAAMNTPAAPSASPTPAPPAPKPANATSTSTSSAAQKTTPLSQQTPAAGGGPGMVWVNTASMTYHCPGTAYYGKTKAGKYEAEDAAKAEGAHADHGKHCSK